MGRPNPNQRYFWRAELNRALQRAYRSARSRQELTRNLDHLQRVTGFTRVVIISRAARVGLQFCRRRPWTASEIELLRENLGSTGQAAIARQLGRSSHSVKAQISRLGLSSRLTDGYSQNDIAELLGVSPKTVRRWVLAGWLRLQGGRITEQSISRFLRRHPEAYQLNRVDEAWFKGLLFPAYNRADIHKPAESWPLDVAGGNGALELVRRQPPAPALQPN